ncbi:MULTISPECIES: histidinol-phosphate transaminase [unclassified Sporosarcina]|uniref:histidinol-phosphate transaminase n=1 Tax=unclassified Sporosarcina TaxID=2647733 RepID=UPI00203D3031|nr:MULTISPECIES: histidinol-phosphate transaminase [unclassified Sporosarcina]GKV64809.1 histidinol-phosphate aminotransferase [Sporosarcina sp. NCCP-2331]GLB54919.1 histidinol-phosphate aminotransferase [Sporosarcina sp. NCCP-2378]
MMKNLWRKEVHNLTPYVPGKPIEDVKRELGLDEVIRLASNENPYGPSVKALSAMLRSVRDSWLYPEPTSRELREALGQKYGLDAEQLIVANGADHIISLLGHAYINEGDEVIYCQPTFSSYEAVTLLMGGVPVEVTSNEDFTVNLKGILEAVTDKTKLIFICNPNNPTGTIVDDDELLTFLESLPSHVIAILDEAYVEYVDSPKYKTCIDFIKAGLPVIGVRTFSKFYGLAGARVGYAMANSKYIQSLQAVRQTFAVNRIALAGALASLEDEAFGAGVFEKNCSERQRLTDALIDLECEVVDSQSNFIFVNVKQDISKVFARLMERGLLIRPCTPWKLSTYGRITIGTNEENNKLIQALKEVL